MTIEARFEEFDHTADAGIEVYARSLDRLFETAASGMFSLLIEANTIENRRRERFEVEASDIPSLMVSWLGELNYRHLTEGLVFAAFEIQEISESRLVAEAAGESFESDRHSILTEIKAVTFHDLVVEHRNDDGWYARIIFDI